jgi:hypothetical protein
MVFNATVSNISVISWWSVLLVEETEYPEKTTDTDKPYHIKLYRVLLAMSEIRTHNFFLVLICILYACTYIFYITFILSDIIVIRVAVVIRMQSVPITTDVFEFESRSG